jgi:hypothetical protein
MYNITGVGAYFGAQCEKRGMLVRVAGDLIMMSPPFIISPEEVDEVTSQTNFCSCHFIKLKKSGLEKSITEIKLLNVTVKKHTFSVQSSMCLIYIAKISMKGHIHIPLFEWLALNFIHT